MATELVPWLRNSFAVSTNPRDIVIGGYSAGARAATYVALHHPDVFGNALLQSGGGNFILLIEQTPKAAVRFYLDSDSYGMWQWESNARTNPITQSAIRDALQSRGYEVTYRESGGAHESTLGRLPRRRPCRTARRERQVTRRRMFPQPIG